jgi:hypothetical protein
MNILRRIFGVGKYRSNFDLAFRQCTKQCRDVPTLCTVHAQQPALSCNSYLVQLKSCVLTHNSSIVTCNIVSQIVRNSYTVTITQIARVAQVAVAKKVLRHGIFTKDETSISCSIFWRFHVRIAATSSIIHRIFVVVFRLLRPNLKINITVSYHIISLSSAIITVPQNVL